LVTFSLSKKESFPDFTSIRIALLRSPGPVC
jgi:hypothetical protein